MKNRSKKVLVILALSMLSACGLFNKKKEFVPPRNITDANDSCSNYVIQRWTEDSSKVDSGSLYLVRKREGYGTCITIILCWDYTVFEEYEMYIRFKDFKSVDNKIETSVFFFPSDVLNGSIYIDEKYISLGGKFKKKRTNKVTSGEYYCKRVFNDYTVTIIMGTDTLKEQLNGREGAKRFSLCGPPGSSILIDELTVKYLGKTKTETFDDPKKMKIELTGISK